MSTLSLARVAVLIAGGLVLGATGAQALDLKVRLRPASVEPRVEMVAAAVEVPVPAALARAEQGQAAAERIVQIPACARKVKVIYAGYGEGDRATCDGAAAR